MKQTHQVQFTKQREHISSYSQSNSFRDRGSFVVFWFFSLVFFSSPFGKNERTMPNKQPNNLLIGVMKLIIKRT